MRCAILFALAAAPSGCAATFPTPPPLSPLDGVRLDRFQRVAEGVYRSSQPSGAQLRELVRRYGIRTVLKLNAGRDDAPPGVTVLHRPLSVMSEPSPAELARVVAAVEQAPRPVLIHCTHGEDRTGLVVALYRMRRGVTAEMAYAEMGRHRFHPYPGVWRAWLRASGWGAPARRPR
jgi:tyrosine-protein phosphatase SIW14